IKRAVDGKHGLVEREVEETTGIKYATAVERFLKEKKKQVGFRNVSYDGYSSTFKAVFGAFWEGKRLNTISPEMVAEALMSQQTNGKSIASVRSYFLRARVFFNWCVKNKYLRASPIQGVRPPKAGSKLNHL